MTALVYDCIYTVFLALTAMLYYGGFAGMEKTEPGAVEVTLLAVPAVLAFLHLKKTGRTVLLLVFVTGFLWLWFLYHRHTAAFEQIGYIRYFPYLILSLVFSIFGICMARFIIFRLAGTVAALICLILSLIGFAKPGKAGVFLTMLLLLTYAASFVQRGWKREGFTEEKFHLISIFPFLAILILTASLIHYPKKPYDWKPFIKAWDRLMSVGDRIQFGLLANGDTVIGFSENGQLPDWLQDSKRKVLKVTTEEGVDSAVYLGGMVFDTFDGHSWTRKHSLSLPERSFDAMESLAAQKYNETTLGDLFRKTDLTVEYLDTKSRYLFAPAKLVEYDAPSSHVSIREKKGSFMFLWHNPYRLKVLESYYRVNSDNAAFYDYMKRADIPGESAWLRARQVLLPNLSGCDYTYEEYESYRQETTAVYSQEISLPSDLKKQMEELFAGAESDYEKCKRLEAFLQNMEYNTKPPAIPKNVSDAEGFLNYFFSQNEGGYCSYYATAFTLLARSMGLPARYVQGYRMVPKESGKTVITSNMAHAWPEVYFEGKGWIAFEPTPGYWGGSLWKTRDQIKADEDFISKSDVYQSWPARKNAAEIPEEEEELPESGISALPFSPVYLLLPLLLLPVLLLLFFVFNRLQQKMRFKRLEPCAQYTVLSKECLHILKRLGKTPECGETLSEFRTRIAKQTDEVQNAAFGFIDGYERILYDPMIAEQTGPDPAVALLSKKLLLTKLKKKHKLAWIFMV